MDCLQGQCFWLHCINMRIDNHKNIVSVRCEKSFSTEICSLNYLSTPKDHLPPAHFCSHFRLVSRLYIAVLPLWPSSSSPQVGCRRYNPSNAALPSTVRLLPTCSVGTSICLSRTTNLPPSGRLSITASTVSNWRGKVSQRNPMPFLLRTTSKQSSYAGRSMMSRWPIP